MAIKTAKTAKAAKTAAIQPDVYERVTAAIVAALEAGTPPWTRPWNAAGPVSRPLRHDGTPYRGVNVLMLWRAAMENGDAAPYWMTYRQAQALGGQVRQGEHGALVVYANAIKKTETDPATGEEVETEIPFMKGYTVFNADQIDGLPARFHATATAPVRSDAERSARLDAFFTAAGADVRYGGHRAFYAIDEDRIQMPPFETFHSPERYYATLAHECVRIPRKLDSRSMANWTPVPRQSGQSERRDAGVESVYSWMGSSVNGGWNLRRDSPTRGSGWA